MTEREFWTMYQQDKYEEKRSKYHANDVFYDVYHKVKNPLVDLSKYEKEEDKQDE